MKKTNLYILLVTVFATHSLFSMQQEISKTESQNKIIALTLLNKQQADEISKYKSFINDLTDLMTPRDNGSHPYQNVLTCNASVSSINKLFEKFKQSLNSKEKK